MCIQDVHALHGFYELLIVVIIEKKTCTGTLKELNGCFLQVLDSLNHCLPKKIHILIKISKVDLIGNLLTTRHPVVTFFKQKKAKFMFLYSVKWCLVNICQQMYHFLLFKKI